MKKDYLKNDYNFNQSIKKAKGELQTRLNSYKNQLIILRSIKRIYKKDWSYFQNFLKNFETMDWINMSYSWIIEKNDEIKISWYINNEYEKIYINTYTIDKDFVEEIRKSDPTRIVENLYLKDRVYYTIEEFYQKIQEKIQRTEKHIEKLENSLSKFNETIKNLEKLINPILFYIADLKDSNLSIRCKEIVEKTIKNF